jgi:hypothetical protein
MSQSAIKGVPATPYRSEIRFAAASGTGNINPGDWLCYSGQYVIAQFSGNAPGTAYWKSSGAGVAIQANPIYDQAGRVIQNSALQFMVEGIAVVSAAFSGEPGLGLSVYPVSTGSGVAAPTGASGVSSTWQTAQVRFGSALSGTASPQQPGVGTVVGSQNFSNAGTGELIVRFVALSPDVRG